MLVLTRQTGERIMVGEDIVITVVRIGPNNVRIGISCPREMRIVREELITKDAANEAALITTTKPGVLP